MHSVSCGRLGVLVGCYGSRLSLLIECQAKLSEAESFAVQSVYTLHYICQHNYIYIHMYILYFHGARRFGIIQRRQSTHTARIALKQCSLHQTCAVCAVSALLYAVLHC